MSDPEEDGDYLHRIRAGDEQPAALHVRYLQLTRALDRVTRQLGLDEDEDDV